MKMFLVVLASGRGERFKSLLPKQFVQVSGKTILEHALSVFSSSGLFSKTVVTLPPDFEDAVLKKKLTDTGAILIPGGSERQDSVLGALTSLSEYARGDEDFVFVHDGVRPFVSLDLIERLVKATAENDAVIPVIPISDTVKEIKGDRVVRTMDRMKLAGAQTPQAFRFRKLYNYYTGAKDAGSLFTDDASIFEAFGGEVRVITGSPDNMKITEPGDLEIARKKLLSLHPDTTDPLEGSRKFHTKKETEFRKYRSRDPQGEFRIGYGYDVHRLVEGRDLVLCGEKIPFEKGLLGHSDADVALHAIIDSLLGAAGLGDIGALFPSYDSDYQNISSLLLLQRTNEAIGQKGYEAHNIDVTIVAEAPRIHPLRAKMRANIANCLDLPLHNINIKATTTEGLGFEGEKKGISAHAVSTVRPAPEGAS